MDVFEYRVDRALTTMGAPGLLGTLNVAGSEGWELVAVYPVPADAPRQPFGESVDLVYKRRLS